MYESGNLVSFIPEDDCNNHLTTLNKSSLHHYKHSLERCSNRISHTLCKEVWQRNEELFSDGAMNCILGSTNKLLNNCDTGNANTWKSSLSKFTDPEVLFDQSVPPCDQCSTPTADKTLSAFLNNECKCNLGINKPQNKPQTGKTKTGLIKNISYDSSHESKTGDDQRLLFKPKFARPRLAAKNLLTKPSIQEVPVMKPSYYQDIPSKPITVQEIDIDKEEEENKAHKSNVARITFKTAKETFLASNPAAKRSLGASRKASSKFVSPMLGAAAGAGGQEKQDSQEPTYTDERLKHIHPKMIELIESEIIDNGAPIGWDDIAGLQLAKATIQEAVVWPLLRPDLFTGLRRPPKGILLFGPPGTGKTLIGKCVAAQCNATFFSISASSLTSKWIGDGEKMVRALFAVARCHQPAVIFIDEIDSLLTARSDGEHEATRRIKTEFLVQFDGAATGEDDRLLIVGATNRPQELDEAARRRLVKRLYIPLPDADARKQIITNLLKNESNELSEQQVCEVASLTEGYSGADMRSLCGEAAMGPVRCLPPPAIHAIHKDQVRPVNIQDFKNALQRVRPSVSQDDLGVYVKWNNTYGQGF